MPKDYRIGPCRIYTASALSDPLGEWSYVGPTRGNVVVTPQPAEVARGRADQTGAAPLAAAVWQSSREINATAPLVDRDLTRLERIFPGTVKVVSGSKKTLKFQPTTAGITPQAYAIVPEEEWSKNNPWWDSPHTVWLDKAYVMITSEIPVGEEIGDNDDALSDTVYEVEFRRALGSNSGLGEIWLNDVSVLGLDIAYQPEFDQVDAILGESAGTFSRSSTATYLDDDGTYNSVGTDAARYVSGKRLLMEPQRTNAIPDSEAIDQWSTSNVTVTVDDTTAPDGNTTADKVVEDSQDTTHRIFQSVSYSDDQAVTLSMFGEAAERDWIVMEARITDGSNFETARVWVDFANGVLGTEQTQANVSITDKGILKSQTQNGSFYRAFMTVDPASGWSVDAVRPGLSDADASLTYAGDGSSGAYMWGIQTEAGSFPTSYIPTSGSAVTRSADSLDPLSDYTKSYNASEGLTLYIKTQLLWDANAGPKNAKFLHRVRKDGNDQIGIRAHTGVIDVLTVAGGATEEEDVSTGHSRGDTIELVLREQPTGYAASYALNGGSPTDSTISVLSTNHADGLTWATSTILGFGGEVITAHVARGDHTLSEMRTLAR